MKKAHRLYLDNVKSGKRSPALVLEKDLPKQGSLGPAVRTRGPLVPVAESAEDMDERHIASLIAAVEHCADTTASCSTASDHAYTAAHAAHHALSSLRGAATVHEEADRRALQQAFELSSAALQAVQLAQSEALNAKLAAAQAATELAQLSGESEPFTTRASSSKGEGATGKGGLVLGGDNDDDVPVGCVPSVLPRTAKSSHLSTESSKNVDIQRDVDDKTGAARQIRGASANKSRPKRNKSKQTVAASALAPAPVSLGEGEGEEYALLRRQQDEAARVALPPQEVCLLMLIACNFVLAFFNLLVCCISSFFPSGLCGYAYGEDVDRALG
jgi:hypothetical protein